MSVPSGGPPPRLEGRYRFVRTLGQGGMGAVYQVHDAERGEDVALKRVLADSPEALLRFKREFRVVERLLHPNLVRLHELGEDAEGPYFTMELVDGVDLGTYCARSSVRSAVRARRSDEDAATLPSVEAVVGHAPTLATPRGGDAPTDTSRIAPPASLEAVLHIAPQLLEALAFLHAHGIVHRDLKPSNVMVRPDGHLVLLDFGILATPSDVPEHGTVVGTIGYMPPEQLRGAPADPSFDVYAFGASLFELLAGRPVFDADTPMHRVVLHTTREPERLDRMVEDVPEVVADVVEALLARDAATRPTLTEAAAALELCGARRARLAPARPPRTSLVGREAIASRLQARVVPGSGERPVVLRGPSGSGKTALAEDCAQALARDGVLVLRGRGRANDRLAFNAIDGVVDELALALRRERALPDDVRELADAAAVAFPVLGSGAPFSADRPAAFTALRRLLERAGGEGGVLLIVDDLQWADADALRLLDELSGERVRVLGTLRDDVPSERVARWLDASGAAVIEVDPLEGSALEVIVRRAAGEDADPARVRSAARSAQGRPFLAELAGRAIARGARGDPMRALLDAALADDTDLLAAVVAADEWTELATLARHLARSPGAVDDRVRQLEALGVVRRTGVLGAGGRVDVYHDAIRAGLDAALPGALVHAHARFVALGEEGLALEPARRVRHLLGAERPREAAAAALEAAAAAEQQLAFGLAADMLEVAIDHGDGDPKPLLRRRAENLERIARYGDAAEEWGRIADASGAEERLEALTRSANALLGANRLDEGAARLEEALRAGGDHTLGRRALADVLAGLRFLRGPWRTRGEGRRAGDEALRRRAEAEIRLGLMLGYFDPLAGLRILVRGRNRYGRLGDQERIAWCDALFAAFADFGHRGTTESRLAARYLAAAGARLTDHGLEGGAFFEALDGYLRGSLAWRQGRWGEAIAALEGGLGQLDAAGQRGIFEYTYIITTIGSVHWVAQDLDGVEAAVRRFHVLKRDGSDLTLEAHLLFMTVVLEAWRGDVERARSALEEAWRTLPSVPTIQRPIVGYLGAIPDVVVGDPAAALDRTLEADPLAKRFRLLRSHVGPLHAAVSAFTECLALRQGHPRASARRVRRRLRIVRDGGPMTAGQPERIEAYLAEHRGDEQGAVEWLVRSEAAAETAARPLDVAIAKMQRGLRLGGDEGDALVREATEVAAAARVSLDVLREDPTRR